MLRSGERYLDSPSIAAQEAVVKVCDEFEVAWKAGDAPVIEQFLGRLPEEQRSTLLRDLIELELELRQKIGDTPAQDTYLRRFPGHAELIEACFTAARHAYPPSNVNDSLELPPRPRYHDEEDVGRWFGDFELLEQIAVGGMGIVYKAHQVSLDRIVALKMILRGHFATRSEGERFHREAQAAAHLRHFNIVSVHGYGIHAGRSYIVMDFVEGVTLAEKVTESPFPPVEAANIVKRVAEAIHFAHQHGVIHRDIKPSNVLLDRQGCPLVTDFGLAKRIQTDSSLTNTGQVLGTPSYMPPEQARGTENDVGPTADVYALGATLYCLLTGRPPFQAATPLETLCQVIEREPVSPRQLNPAVNRDLETICLKCLRKEPGLRYATAEDLALDIDRYLGGRAIEARPISPVVKLIRWTSRNRLLAALAATAAILALALAVGTTLASIRMRSAYKTIKTQLVRQYVLNGMRMMESGDGINALPWLVRALQLEEGSLEEEKIHRLRIGDVLSRCPRLVDFKSLDKSPEPDSLSPDGRRSISISGHEAHVVDARTGLALTPKFSHGSPITRAGFDSEGRRVVTIGGRQARIWNAADGTSLGPPLNHRDQVNSAEFSPDGKLLLTAVGGRDLGPVGEAVLWNLETSQPILPNLKHDDDVYSAKFSADGKSIVTSSYDLTAQVWDSTTHKRIFPPLLHEQPVSYACFSPDGTLVATLVSDQVRIWDAKTGTSTAPPLKHFGVIRRVAFTPDSRQVLTEGFDQRVRFWDSARGTALPLTISGHGLSFNTDGRRFSLRGGDRTWRFWDPASSARAPLQFKHAHYVNAALFSSSDQRIITASWDHSWRVWDATTEIPTTPPIVHGGSVNSIALSPDGRLAVTASLDHSARVWNVMTGKPVSPPLTHADCVLHATFSPDGRHVLTSSIDSTARLWDYRTGRTILAPLRHSSDVIFATFDPSGQRIATTCSDGTARLWNASNGEPISAPLRHHGWVVHAAFSPDGGLLVTSSRDRSARVWNCATGEEQFPELKHEDFVNYAEFSPDGERIVTASSDRSAKVWSARDGKPITPPLVHREPVNQAIFSPDGLCVLTASGGPATSECGEAQIWDANTGNAISMPFPHRDDVKTLKLSADGRRLLTSSSDMSARIWAVPYEARSVAELGALSDLMSGFRVDDTGSLVPLTTAELDSAWKVLKKWSPGELGCSASELNIWHRQEAEACESQRRWSRAVYHLTGLVKTEPTRFDWLYRRALAYAELGDRKRAAADFAAAIHAGIEEPRAWYYLALLQLSMDDTPGYKITLENFYQHFLGTSDTSALNLLSWANSLSPTGQPDRAVPFAFRCVDSSPEKPTFRNTLGAALFRANRLTECVECLERVVQSQGGDGLFSEWLFLAMANHRLGRQEQAKDWLDRADRWWGRIRGDLPPVERTPPLIRWQDRLVFQLLHKESEALFHPTRVGESAVVRDRCTGQ